jgi:CTP synthase (UTP-ammonia lyase)
VLGFRDADHAETNADSERLVITPLACSLVGQTQRVVLVPGTRAAQLYRSLETIEDYFCNYGVNPDYRLRLEAFGLKVSGVGGEGEIRTVEISEHPFFVATLFLPQARSTAARPHPLVVGYAAAIAAAREARSHLSPT